VQRRRLALGSSLAALLACATTKPVELGIRYDRLAPCPTSPNCMSSDALDPSHRVAPFEFRGPPAEAWQAARDAVAALPRTQIVSDTGSYLHAECTSRLFGFVDDLELHLRPDRSLIAVRSASREGYTDLGVNRRRLAQLRSELQRRGIVPPWSRALVSPPGSAPRIERKATAASCPELRREVSRVGKAWGPASAETCSPAGGRRRRTAPTDPAG
jgi:uncharacterized protein (DUF1499 family)